MHNTHHAFPSSAFVGPRWWHFDISGWLIRAFAALGLAWDVKTPPAAAWQPSLVLPPRDTPGAVPP
jgi:stearoyl-CoA desaturase (delta-9 desaturase)